MSRNYMSIASDTGYNIGNSMLCLGVHIFLLFWFFDIYSVSTNCINDAKRTND